MPARRGANAGGNGSGPESQMARWRMDGLTSVNEELKQRPVKSAHDAPVSTPKKKRKSGIPTGNAGEYFVMGELLRRGFDAQLADRNTKAYDILVGRTESAELRKVQVKTVRTQPWYVKQSSFEGEVLNQVTIYVLIGKEDGNTPVRYFIARNRDLAGEVSTPTNWVDNGFMMLRSLTSFEDRWHVLSE
jgi:hypothetical protein